jgi:hypothetical protein
VDYLVVRIGPGGVQMPTEWIPRAVDEFIA